MCTLEGEGRRDVRRDAETGERIVHTVNRETGERQEGGTCAQPPRPPVPPALPLHTFSGASPRLLLIPTSMIFPSVVTVLLMLLEIYLHVRCHRQNRATKRSSVYYRSPFHALTSRFCGACRESELALRVGALQDRRRDRYHYLQGIVS